MITNVSVLGKTPELKNENVFNKFLYTYRIENNSSVGPLFRMDAESWLSKKYEEIQYSSQIEKEKEWWVYALLILRRSFSVYNKLYGVSIAERILYEVELLSVEELERKVNALALTHNEVYPVFLTPRITLMEDVGSCYRQNKTLKTMVIKIDIMYSYLKENFSESYIKPEHLEGFGSKRDYTTLLHWYAESLLTDIGFSLASCSNEEEEKEVLKGYEEHLPILIKHFTDVRQFDLTLFIKELMDIVKGEEFD